MSANGEKSVVNNVGLPKIDLSSMSPEEIAALTKLLESRNSTWEKIIAQWKHLTEQQESPPPKDSDA